MNIRKLDPDVLHEIESVPVLQRDIDDGDVGPLLLDNVKCLVAGLCLADDLEVHLGADRILYCVAKRRMIIDDEYAGSIALPDIGPWGSPSRPNLRHVCTRAGSLCTRVRA